METITHQPENLMAHRARPTARRRVRLFAVLAVSAAAVALPTAAQAFNPQPDPPRGAIAVCPAFNPQPDPPRGAIAVCPAFNPQPDPPRGAIS